MNKRNIYENIELGKAIATNIQMDIDKARTIAERMTGKNENEKYLNYLNQMIDIIKTKLDRVDHVVNDIYNGIDEIEVEEENVIEIKDVINEDIVEADHEIINKNELVEVITDKVMVNLDKGQEFVNMGEGKLDVVRQIVNEVIGTDIKFKPNKKTVKRVANITTGINNKACALSELLDRLTGKIVEANINDVTVNNVVDKINKTNEAILNGAAKINQTIETAGNIIDNGKTVIKAIKNVGFAEAAKRLGKWLGKFVKGVIVTAATTIHPALGSAAGVLLNVAEQKLLN